MTRDAQREVSLDIRSLSERGASYIKGYRKFAFCMVYERVMRLSSWRGPLVLNCFEHHQTLGTSGHLISVVSFALFSCFDFQLIPRGRIS